ncbi:hypothetical protein QZH41_009773 [Actinostola sp. cb2023]|nr:hypothetical protein QZH41_009773 [Actinostola sp. cb2023]
MGNEGNEKIVNETVGEMYTGKYILAPMVRIGTLPSRLLALRYGADLVYSEEIIDFKMLKTTRVENKLLQTVDFVMADGTVVFRTCKEEQDKVVFQMVNLTPLLFMPLLSKFIDSFCCCGILELLTQHGLSKQLYMYISKTDLQLMMYDFIVHKGARCLCYRCEYGMSKGLFCERWHGSCIINKARKGLRYSNYIGQRDSQASYMQDKDFTNSTYKYIQNINNIVLIEKHERSLQPVHNDVLGAIADALSIPVIANGGSLDITTFEEMKNYRQQTRCSSVMVARAAQWNFSVFRY